MNILVSGDTQFNDWKTFVRSIERLSFIQHPTEEICILSCHNGEADHMGERYAGLHKWRCMVLPLETNKYGSDAFMLRNSELVQITDGAIIFWDNKNKDTAYLIKILKMSNRPTIIFDYYGNIIENFIPVKKR